MSKLDRNDKLDLKAVLFILFMVIFGISFSLYLFFTNNYFIPKDGIETTMTLVDVEKTNSEVSNGVSSSSRHRKSIKTNYNIILFDNETNDFYYVGTSYFMYKYIKNLGDYKDKEISVVVKDINDYEKLIVIGNLNDKKRTLRFLDVN